MKKKLLALIFALFILPCAFLLSACNHGTVYYANVPLDLVYCATATEYLETTNEAHDNFKEKTTTLYAVSQKYEMIAGENRFVTYVEWRQIGHWWMYGGPYDSDKSYTFLNVGGVDGKVFVWDEDNNNWHQGDLSSIYTYSSRYSNRTNSDSFRYKMESPLFLYYGATGRELHDKYKTETTDEYIEYVCKDNEIFRVSNDKYNVCLKYEFDNVRYGSKNMHNATWEVGSTDVPHLTTGVTPTTNGAKTSHIPHIDKITAAMLAD